VLNYAGSAPGGSGEKVLSASRGGIDGSARAGENDPMSNKNEIASVPADGYRKNFAGGSTTGREKNSRKGLRRVKEGSCHHRETEGPSTHAAKSS